MKGPMAYGQVGWLPADCHTSGMPCSHAALMHTHRMGFRSLVPGEDHQRSSHGLLEQGGTSAVTSQTPPMLRETTCSQKSKRSLPFPRNIHRPPLLQAESQHSIIPFCGSWLRVHPSSQAHNSSDYSHAGPVGTQSHQ